MFTALYRLVLSQTPKQFYCGFGNAVSEQESNALHAKYHIPAPGKPLFQAALANFLHARSRQLKGVR